MSEVKNVPTDVVLKATAHLIEDYERKPDDRLEPHHLDEYAASSKFFSSLAFDDLGPLNKLLHWSGGMGPRMGRAADAARSFAKMVKRIDEKSSTPGILSTHELHTLNTLAPGSLSAIVEMVANDQHSAVKADGVEMQAALVHFRGVVREALEPRMGKKLTPDQVKQLPHSVQLFIETGTSHEVNTILNEINEDRPGTVLRELDSFVARMVHGETRSWRMPVLSEKQYALGDQVLADYRQANAR